MFGASAFGGQQTSAFGNPAPVSSSFAAPTQVSPTSVSFSAYRK